MHQLLSAYNEYTEITNEFTGPKHFVITRVHCICIYNFEISGYFVISEFL